MDGRGTDLGAGWGREEAVSRRRSYPAALVVTLVAAAALGCRSQAPPEEGAASAPESTHPLVYLNEEGPARGARTPAGREAPEAPRTPRPASREALDRTAAARAAGAGEGAAAPRAPEPEEAAGAASALSPEERERRLQALEEENERRRKRLEDLRERLERKRQRTHLEEITADSFTPVEEEAVGLATARAILARFQALPPGDPLPQYVNKVGALLGTHSGRPALHYRFVVIEDGAVNAFAAPYGFVFITTGALRFLRNEAELAVVLAHEIAHVVNKHGLTKLALAQPDLEKREMSQRAEAMSKLPRSEREKSLQKRMYHLSDLVLEGKTRPQEEEADRVGLRIVSSAGYDPRAALDFLARMAEAAGPGEATPVIFQSHPHMKDRLEAARGDLRSLRSGGAVPVERFLQATAALRKSP